MTSSPEQPSSRPDGARDHLHEVDQAVLDTFNAATPDFEKLYAHFLEVNPLLATHLRDRAEQLAPLDIRKKERLARLAFEALALIEAQTEVDGLEAQLRTSSEADNVPNN